MCCIAAKTKLSGLSLFLYRKRVGAWKTSSKHKIFQKIRERHTGFSNGEKIGSSCFHISKCNYNNIAQLIHQRQCSTRLMEKNGFRVCKLIKMECSFLDTVLQLLSEHIIAFLPGKVLKVHGDGTFDVEYEDGEIIQHDTDPSMRKQAPRHRGRISVQSNHCKSTDSFALNLNKSRNNILPRRPRGRNPKGVKWDYTIGQWVKERPQNSKVQAKRLCPIFHHLLFQIAVFRFLHKLAMFCPVWFSHRILSCLHPYRHQLATPLRFGILSVFHVGYVHDLTHSICSVEICRSIVKKYEKKKIGPRC